MHRILVLSVALVGCAETQEPWRERYLAAREEAGRAWETRYRESDVRRVRAEQRCTVCETRLALVEAENRELRDQVATLGQRLRAQVQRVNVLIDINNGLTRENRELRERLEAESERLRQAQSSLYRLRQMGEHESVPPSVRRDVSRGELSPGTLEWCTEQVQRQTQAEAQQSRARHESGGVCEQALHAAVDIGENLLGFVPAQRLAARLALAILQWAGGTQPIQRVVDNAIRAVCV